MLHRPRNILLLNLFFSGCLISVFSILSNIDNMINSHNWVLGKVKQIFICDLFSKKFSLFFYINQKLPCKLLNFSKALGNSAYAIFIVVNSLERYLLLQHPKVSLSVFSVIENITNTRPSIKTFSAHRNTVSTSVLYSTFVRAPNRKMSFQVSHSFILF
jgi:hypothetical protein